ncbi:MAG: hypothetical protein AAF581_05580 [Planctomycetota bacterium]
MPKARSLLVLLLLVAPMAYAAEPSVSKLRKALRSGDSEQARLTALAELEKLAKSEREQPADEKLAKQVTSIIASALGDDSMQVRERAAEILGAVGHPQSAPVKLGSVLDKARKQAKSKSSKLKKKQKQWADAMMTGVGSGKRRDPNAPFDPRKELERLEKEMELFEKGKKKADKIQVEIDAITLEWQAAIATGSAAAKALASYPTPRARKRVRSFYDTIYKYSPRTAEHAAVALLEFGLRDDVGAVAESLSDYQRQMDRHAEWEKEKQADDDSYEPRPMSDYWGKRVYERLQKFAVAQKLAPLEDWSPGFAPRAKKWFKAVKASLPEALPDPDKGVEKAKPAE